MLPPAPLESGMGSGRIIMLTAEPRAPYIRPLLSKAAFSGLNPARISLGTESLNLELFSKCKALRIDIRQRRVFSTSGSFEYDACVYAMGAHPFVPDFPGSRGGYTFRCTEDFFAIKRILPSSSTAAIVGGGVIGVEMAWLLRERGLSVRILELAPRLMPRQLDDEASVLVCRLLESRGIEVRNRRDAYDGSQGPTFSSSPAAFARTTMSQRRPAFP